MITPTSTGSSNNGQNKGGGLFRLPDGQNMLVTFILVTSLFLVWGVCNSMIDILNKHFQDSLNISKMQSAFVQFANYMGYFFMAIPSGMLARRFGYKGAIIAGLGLVALGAFWFIPATHIGTYWAFLLGLFVLAAGLTCLETVANPYTTVLGPPASSTVRINLAQSINGVGWMIGPILGGIFVLSSTSEANTSNADLYKPYLIVGIAVTLLTLVFVAAKVPDLHAPEECAPADKPVAAVSAPVVVKPLFRRWHFILAVAAQFLYVAAQTGVFSYFINYISSDTPVLSQSIAGKLQGGADVLHDLHLAPPVKMIYPAALFSADDVTNVTGLVARLQNDSEPGSRAVSQLIWTQFSTNQTLLVSNLTVSQSADPDAAKDLEHNQSAVLVNGLNRMLQTNLLEQPEFLAATTLPAEITKQAANNMSGEELVRFNRSLLETVYPNTLVARSPYLHDSVFHVTDRGASLLLSFGAFAFFLLGRFTGSFALRFCKGQILLALYAAMNVLMMVLTICPLGWWSVVGLFLSFFFMSIMYPTIFALGIHGLGEQTKKAASFIVMSIVGGAIMPLFMGWLADHWGMRIGFLMPLLCFMFIAFYGIVWQKLERLDSRPGR